MTRFSEGMEHVRVNGPASLPHMRDFCRAMLPYVRSDDRAQRASMNPLDPLGEGSDWEMYYATPAFAALFHEVEQSWDDSEYLTMMSDISRHLGDRTEGSLFMGFDRRSRPWLALQRGPFEEARPWFDIEEKDEAVVDGGRQFQQADAVALGWALLPDGYDYTADDPRIWRQAEDPSGMRPYVLSAVTYLNNGVIRTGIGNSRTVKVAILLAWIMVNPEPNLVTVVEQAAQAGIPPRARTGSKRDQKARVKVVDLRKQTVRTLRDVDEARAGRSLSHRFVVRGHWRKQAFGPGRLDRKMVYIAPFIKGPADAPFVQRETVFRW